MSGWDLMVFAREAVAGHGSLLKLVTEYKQQLASLDRRIAALRAQRDGLEGARSTHQQRLDSQADLCYRQLSELAVSADVDQLQVLAAIEYLWENLENQDMAALQSVINGTKRLITWPSGTPVVVWDLIKHDGWFGQRLAHQPRLMWSEGEWRVKIQLCAAQHETPVMTVIRIEELTDLPRALERRRIYIGRQAIVALVRTNRANLERTALFAAAQAAGVEM